MIHSMTGYGKAVGQNQNKKFTVELRSLNSKGLDLSIKMSSLYREKEMPLRNELSKLLERGKCDLSIFFESVSEYAVPAINETLLLSYANEMKKIAGKLDQQNEPDFFSLALRMPEVMQTQREELNPDEWAFVRALIDGAIENFNSFRKQEGDSLRADLQLRIDGIRSRLSTVETLADNRKDMIRERLMTAITELGDKVSPDMNRFEQELIYYLEKLDITEERVRLKNHLSYFETTMNGDGNEGRKLGFIGQEIGREINTIGSKCNDADIQKMVVEMKDELEKIKEQVLNVL